MPKKAIDYSKAVIYKICCKDLKVTDVYVGSTTNLAQRRSSHKTACTKENDKSYNSPVYRFIRDKGGFDNWEVIKIQDVECTCSDDLLKIERECLERLGATLNKQVPGNQIGKSKKEYRKEYREANKTEIVEKENRYYETNKTEILEKKKQYYDKNKDKIREQRKEYHKANRDEILEKKKQYRQDNKTEISEKKKQKVTCDCGLLVNKCNLARHRSSKKHQYYLLLTIALTDLANQTE
jgi:hypothetical protein